MIRSVALLLFFALALLASPAAAQSTAVTSSVDTDEVELGDTISLTLAAQSEGESASDPQPGPHPGFTIVDTAAAPTHIVSIVNGRRSERRGLNVTWTMRADRIGTFTLGPPSLAVASGRKSAQAVRVTVVARGKATKPRRSPQPQGPQNPFDPFGGIRRGGSPLDPWKGIFPGMDDDEGDALFPQQVTGDPALALPEPRAPIAFLHATIDKTRAVVGEQVTLHVYLYEDPHARQGQPSDVHEATATDFVKRSLLQDETRVVGLGHAIVGGRPWSVKLVRKNALFPLKTGRLSIQPMSLTLPQARVGLRESEVLSVDVTEPTLAGRPSGYQIGDVGDFSLSATVAPRAITQGGAVGVTVELRGTGNIPAQLPLPEVADVEWLEPQTKDALGAMAHDRFGGTRTFSYVVRIHKAGPVDLGEIRLPYFDPSSRSYGLAHAGLGIVDVTPGVVRDAGAEISEEILPGLPPSRHVLEGKHAESYLTERGGYWGLVLGAPLAAAVTIGAHGLLRRARRRRATASPSNDKIARDRRAEAESALRGDDGGAATSAIGRALEAAVLAKTSVNVRGTSGEGALRELADAGITKDTAREVIAVLRACEGARFSPDGVSIDDARALWRRAETVMSGIEAGSAGGGV